ncbi:GNAT family N-acetyltransferase [Salinibacterium sp. M195]|uniref:GNAT family N-acetyltransferase n=1 Tax=Salinibacterium sp. M195 TaxID=2583374 RepID=UPI001C628559|nr:GNAT family N-acetyltransferase [Salinibacterium sp. M195]QYH36574.1 GNAT family N-acetyltransferase [Salinibacterium sp. M195]
MSSLELRAASQADHAAIVAVFLACWRRSYTGLLPQPAIDEMTDERASALWQRVLSETAGPVIVAEREGEILGMVRFAAVGDQGAVHSLYVSPDAQGLGLGTTLLDSAVSSLRTRGAEAARLWVFAANTPSVAFYQSRGWAPDGETRTQQEFGAPEIRLSRSLEASA